MHDNDNSSPYIVLVMFNDSGQNVNNTVTYCGSTANSQYQDLVPQTGMYYYIAIALNETTQSPLSEWISFSIVIYDSFIGAFPPSALGWTSLLLIGILIYHKKQNVKIEANL